MGQRGVHPKPTALRILHGDKKNRINTDEPVPPPGIPTCPPGVSDEVREVWDYTVKVLQAMGCVTMADRDALHAYCEAVVVHRVASRQVADTGMFLGRAKNPALAVQQSAAAMVARYAQHFGLSPSARSEIRNPKNKPNAGGAERFLTG